MDAQVKRTTHIHVRMRTTEMRLIDRAVELAVERKAEWVRRVLLDAARERLADAEAEPAS